MSDTRCWFNCHVATMVGGHYSVIADAAILARGERIAWIGRREQLPGDCQAIDLHGAWVTPGLIDCHTHLVFAGERSAEFELRLEGTSYAEIAAHGGGIASTVRATRNASEEQLLDSAERRARQLMRDGVTCLEVKSGYGLDLASERKLLRVARQLGERLPLTVRTTCLAAHAVPPEYDGRSDDYIDLICEEMLPALAAEGLVDAVDAYCEHLAFSPEQVERLFEAANALGLPVKLHADQLSARGGAGLAARYLALSADHLEYASDADVVAMGAAGTVAVLLPAAFYLLDESRRPPLECLRSHGVPIALGSDLNPGTAPVLSLRLVLAMACTSFGLTPEEALAGVTLHAAHALGLAHRHGSLEVGKLADFVAWDVRRPAELAYWLGGDLPKRVIFHGKEVGDG